MISKVGWTATPVTSYVAKQSPHKRSFFFAFTALVSMYYRCLFSNRRIKKSELFYSDFTFHILPSFWGVSIIFYPPTNTQGPAPSGLVHVGGLTGPQTSVNPDRVRFRLKGPFAADRDPGYQPLGIWSLGYPGKIIGNIHSNNPRWYPNDILIPSILTGISWDISMDYWPLTNPVHAQEGPDGLHSIMGYVGI